MAEINQTSGVKRTLNFSVNDGENGVSGAIVNVDGATGKTGSSGGCTVKNVTDGDHNISIAHDDYVTYNSRVTVDENNTSFTISLTTS